MINTINNEDCLETMTKIPDMVDSIITSPPYNISRTGASDLYNNRYDSYADNMTDEEYIEWTIKLFEGYDSVLKKNGTVLYNISYCSENTTLLWLVIAEIIKRTNFMTADCIVWKKNSAIPNNRSANKLTRIIEYVFVFCRKDEFSTFNCNKIVMSRIEKTNQANYENVFNFVTAPNNNGSTDINKATFSTELVSHLLKLYTKDGDVVYDSFMGTGTTAVACVDNNRKYIGSELSEEQCEYAIKRIEKNTPQKSKNMKKFIKWKK